LNPARDFPLPPDRVHGDEVEQTHEGAEADEVADDTELERPKEVLQQIIDSKVRSHSLVFARYEIAEDPEMLNLMRKAGVTWLFMGVESIDNNTLDLFDKRQTVKKVQEAIQKITQHGIHVSASFVLGGDNDSSDTLLKTAEFAKKSGAAWVMMNILTDFPNGQERVIPSHRVFQKNWDYYNFQFVTHYPKNIRPSDLQQQIYDFYISFYSWRNILTNLAKGKIAVAFYQWFRLLMMGPLLREIEAYIPYLKGIEMDKYDALGHLIEEEEDFQLRRAACG
jgi:radical SAM superfamily enzyme YgiQ (UPF0313 family)